MILGTLLHNQYNFNLYQSRSNEFTCKIGATLWKNIMYEREHRRCKARVGGFGGMPPGKFLKNGYNLMTTGTFHAVYFLYRKHHLQQTKSYFFFKKKDELINFYVISSTCRLVHDYMWCTIGKAIL